MLGLKFWVALGVWGAIVHATPRISYPINSQVPPVARVAQLFDYSFSSSTFTSDYPMTYTLSSAPSWLSLDGTTRTLSGTPLEADVNTDPIIEITATDATGSVTMNSTLVVRGGTGPEIQVPLLSQLASFGTYSTPSSILFYPSTQFQFQFDLETFQEDGSASGLTYYAITSDDTPMPSWIQFDDSKLIFTGLTPDYSSLVEPPQIFGFKLIASDIEGFSGTSLPFNIVVGQHVLSFKDSYTVINATAGKEIAYTGLSGTLMLSGSVANSSDLVSVVASTPDWLSFDNSTFELKGTPPTDAVSTNVTVTAIDFYGDTANATVSLNISSMIFTTTFPEINATIGKPFKENFTSSILDASDVDVSATFTPATTWLSFDSQSLVLSGDVPSDAEPSTIMVSLKATIKSSGLTDTRDLTLHVVSATATASSTTVAASPTSTTAASKTTAASADKTNKRKLSKGAIAAAIVIPLVFLLLALLLCLLCLRRKRQANRSLSPTKSDISGPVKILEINPSGGKFLSEKFRENQNKFIATPEYNNEQHRYSKRYINDALKRSETTSGMSGTDSSNRESRSLNTQTKSFSLNDLTTENGSWKSIRSDSNPITRPRSRSLGGAPRNFSRKPGGHSFMLRRESRSFPLSLSSEGNSGRPFTRFSGLSLYTGNSNEQHSGNSIQETPEAVYGQSGPTGLSVQRKRSSRPLSQLIGLGSSARRESGIGHGKRESTSRYPGGRRNSGIQKRSSIGPPGHGIVRNSRLTLPSQTGQVPGQAGRGLTRTSSWITVQGGDRDSMARKSNCSVLSVDTDVLYPEDGQPKSMKLVPPSPSVLSDNLSTSTVSNQPRSRRAAGGSPFFAGSSRIASSRSGPKKSPGSQSGASQSVSPAIPTVAETNDALAAQIELSLSQNSLEHQVSNALRHTSQADYARNPGLGISYASTQEGNRQLSGYINRFQQSMGRFRTSLTSLSDSSSRFNDASSSPHSGHLYDNEQYERDYINERLRGRNDSSHASPSTWDDRSTQSVGRDSNGNIIEYNDENSPQIAQARQARPSLTLTAVSPNTVAVRGLRWDAGPERRPVSIEAPKRDLSATASHLGTDQENSPGHGQAFL